MSFATLKEAVQRELALDALGGDARPQRRGRFLGLLFEHVPGGCYVRLGRGMLPDWWVRMRDATQVDGRVYLKRFGRDAVNFQIPDGPSFTMDPDQFLSAILDGRALEAQ